MTAAFRDVWFDGERRLTASEAVCQLLQTTPILPGCMEVEFQIRKNNRWGFVFTVLQRLRNGSSAEHAEADETVDVRAFVCVLAPS